MHYKERNMEEITLYEFYPKHYDTTLAFNIFGVIKKGVFECTHSFSYVDKAGNKIDKDYHKGEIFHRCTKFSPTNKFVGAY